MRIEYPRDPNRSKFIKPCGKAIDENREVLLSGGSIDVGLPPKGYSGRVKVKILGTDPIASEADWGYPDQSWFPRRIRAAAYTLLKARCFGEYDISYDRDSGILTIRRI